MGERCFIGFEDGDGKEVDLSVYLHWDGTIDDVYAMCMMARLLGYRSTEDPPYMAARFVFLAGCSTGSESGLSVGLFPDTGHAEDTDHGRYVIGKDWRITDWRGAAYGRDDAVHNGREWVPTGAYADLWRGAMCVLNSRLPERAKVPQDILDDFLAGAPLDECRERLEEHRNRDLYGMEAI